MRVLVTGGAGFIGSHLTRALCARGDAVVVLDDLSTGRRTNLPDGVPLLHGDVRDRDAVERAVARTDVVFHLAAAVGPRLVAEDPVSTWTRNVDGTAAVLDACATAGTRVVIASSSEVYGPNGGVGGEPMRESDAIRLHPGGRRDVYALSKLAGEAYALALHRSRLLPVTVARFFNVVGAGQSARYGMVLARFAAAAAAGRALPVYGDGTQRRCFLHVDDAVAALQALAACAGAEGQIVNVGSGAEVTILDLARRVLDHAPAAAGIEHVPFERVYGEGFVDPVGRVPDVTSIRRLTGWRAERSLDDAVCDALRAAGVPLSPAPR